MLKLFLTLTTIGWLPKINLQMFSYHGCNHNTTQHKIEVFSSHVQTFDDSDNVKREVEIQMNQFFIL